MPLNPLTGTRKGVLELCPCNVSAGYIYKYYGLPDISTGAVAGSGEEALPLSGRGFGGSQLQRCLGAV